jgi:hypothetical protein
MDINSPSRKVRIAAIASQKAAHEPGNLAIIGARLAVCS